MNAQDTNIDAEVRRRLGKFGAIAFCLLSLVVGGIYGSSYMWGRGGRGYFSPDTLDTKTQSEWLIPLTKIPVYRSSFEYHKNDLSQFLIDEEYWKPNEKENPKWISSFHWNMQWHDGESQLHRQLTSRSDDWITWTMANPQFAKLVWPHVLTLLRDGGGESLVLSILLHAQGASDVEGLRLLLEFDGIKLQWQ